MTLNPAPVCMCSKGRITPRSRLQLTRKHLIIYFLVSDMFHIVIVILRMFSQEIKYLDIKRQLKCPLATFLGGTFVCHEMYVPFVQLLYTGHIFPQTTCVVLSCENYLPTLLISQTVRTGVHGVITSKCVKTNFNFCGSL